MQPSCVSSTLAKPVMMVSLAVRRCTARAPSTLTRDSVTVALLTAIAASPSATGKAASSRPRLRVTEAELGGDDTSLVRASRSGLSGTMAKRVGSHSDGPVTKLFKPSTTAGGTDAGDRYVCTAARAGAGRAASSACDSGSLALRLEASRAG